MLNIQMTYSLLFLFNGLLPVLCWSLQLCLCLFCRVVVHACLQGVKQRKRNSWLKVLPSHNLWFVRACEERMVIPKQQPQCRNYFTVCCLGIVTVNLVSQTWWGNHRLRLLSFALMKYPIIKINMLWKWLRPTHITHLTQGLQKLLRFRSVPCSGYVLNLIRKTGITHSDWDLETMTHRVTGLWQRGHAFHSSWRSVYECTVRWGCRLCWLL